MRRSVLAMLVWTGFALGSDVTNDVLNLPPEALLRIEEAQWAEMRLEGVVTARVVDVCIVGSYAQGCARNENGKESDMDIAVFVADYRGCPPAFRASFGSRVAQRTGLGISFDVSVQLTNLMQKNNPDWIAYSLRERKLYGRPDGAARNVKLLWSNNRWQAIPRELYAPAEAHRRQHGSVIFLTDDSLRCVHPGTGNILTVFPARVTASPDTETAQP